MPGSWWRQSLWTDCFTDDCVGDDILFHFHFIYFLMFILPVHPFMSSLSAYTSRIWSPTEKKKDKKDNDNVLDSSGLLGLSGLY